MTDNRLPLRELEPLPRSSTTRLLALHCTWIARQQALLAQLLAVSIVREHQRPRDSQPHRTSLTGQSATHDARLHVERAERVGRGERLLNVRHERRPGEIVAQRAPIDAPLARARRQVDARDAEFAASDRMPAQLWCDRGAHLASTATSGVGCCAACGCSGPAYTFNICFTCWRDSVVFGSMPQTAFSI